MGLLYGENCMTLSSAIFDWSTHITDRQTDGWAIAYTRYSIYAIMRKKKCAMCKCGRGVCSIRWWFATPTSVVCGTRRTISSTFREVDSSLSTFLHWRLLLLLSIFNLKSENSIYWRYTLMPTNMLYTWIKILNNNNNYIYTSKHILITIVLFLTHSSVSFP